MAKKRKSTARKSAATKAQSFGRVSTSLSKSSLMRRIEASKAKKLDLYAKHKNEYLASPLPSFVRVGPALYLGYDGRGKSGATPDFAAGVGAMYSVAFTMKMGFKQAGKDYAVTKLEALWARVDESKPVGPDTIWDWTLLIRVPPYVTGADVAKTIASLMAKGKDDVVRQVNLLELHEDNCVQILHVGSYQDEAPSIEKMRVFAQRAGRSFVGKHHEIYLSDPRRVSPDKLRTILRQPVG